MWQRVTQVRHKCRKVRHKRSSLLLGVSACCSPCSLFSGGGRRVTRDRCAVHSARAPRRDHQPKRPNWAGSAHDLLGSSRANPLPPRALPMGVTKKTERGHHRSAGERAMERD